MNISATSNNNMILENYVAGSFHGISFFPPTLERYALQNCNVHFLTLLRLLLKGYK